MEEKKRNKKQKKPAAQDPASKIEEALETDDQLKAAAASISPKQLAFFHYHYIERLSAYQAAIKAGYTDSYARVITVHVSDNVKGVYRLMLAAAGVTLDKMARTELGLVESADPRIRSQSLTRLQKLFGMVGEGPQSARPPPAQHVQPDGEMTQIANKYEAEAREALARKINPAAYGNRKDRTEES